MIIIKKVLTGEVVTEYKDASWSEIKNDITGNCLEIYSVEYENDNLVVYVF